MTQMVGLNVYRTKNIRITGNAYTARFTVSNDEQDYALFVSNNETNKKIKYQYSEEVAEDFKICRKTMLETKVFEIIKGDIQSGLL